MMHACSQVIRRAAHRGDEQEGYEYGGAKHCEIVLHTQRASFPRVPAACNVGAYINSQKKTANV